MGHPFDEFTMALAEGVTRREALRRLGGGLAGALLASLGMRPAWGDPLDCHAFCLCLPPGLHRDRCLSDAGRGFGLCISCLADRRRLCLVPNPIGGQEEFTCCSPGQTCCPGAGCRNLRTDSNHCGACGRACQKGEECRGGKCVPCVPLGGSGCRQGLECCGGGICSQLTEVCVTCLGRGDICREHSDCCGDLFCINNHTCDGCVPLGEPCDLGNCCAFDRPCDRTTGLCVGCIPVGHMGCHGIVSPTGGPECCRDRACDVTVGGMCVACLPEGHQPCLGNDHCCMGLVCDRGTCVRA
jgi:hypothetical protein